VFRNLPVTPSEDKPHGMALMRHVRFMRHRADYCRERLSQQTSRNTQTVTVS
jgi:hypothetical protein